MNIGILTAMSVEFNQIMGMLYEVKKEQHGTSTYTIGKMGNHTFILLQCGIGKVNAACGVTQLIHHYPVSCIISTGVAGGIDSSVNVMDVVVSSEVCYHDVWCGEGNELGQVQGMPSRFACNQELLEKALHISSDVRIVKGLICTGDQFISDQQELHRIKQSFPEGMAVDMESAAIAQVCYIFGIPFISFRIISDTPGAENHFAQYLNFWDTLADKSFHVSKLFLESL